MPKRANRVRKPVGDGTERWHGTNGGYTNHACGCVRCRTVWAETVKILRQKRLNKPVPEHVHGTPNGYGNYGCRCDACKEAWRVKDRT